MKFRNLLAALLLCGQAHGYAQEAPHTYEPASFPVDQSRIVGKINFPDSAEDVFVRLFCESHLTNSGRLQQSFCGSEYPDADRYISSATRRIDSSRLEPARVDGRRVSVWFQYTVQFERRDGVETIKLFPHHFVGVNGSGENYTGPQRYRASRKTPCRSFYDLWFIMTIPAEGGPPAEIGIEKQDGDEACRGIMLAIAQDSDFIPGFYAGAPIAASYRERWWKVLPIVTPPPLP